MTYTRERDRTKIEHKRKIYCSRRVIKDMTTRDMASFVIGKRADKTLLGTDKDTGRWTGESEACCIGVCRKN